MNEKVDFFSNTCREADRTDSLIGICDDQTNTKAYTDTTDSNKWIAVIKNENNITVSFTPIDHCIVVFKQGSQDKESTCDGMITFTESLFLVELKIQGTGGWRAKALTQLENTVKILAHHHDLSGIKYKKVFASNKKHPTFQVIDNEQNKRFFKNYGFRIDVQAEIVIK
ncbi:MAG: hypothetical protein HC880_13705 [Bacteroidia bacterium]|nr:hypothetical protein [Bacteroidia bacterium]